MVGDFARSSPRSSSEQLSEIDYVSQLRRRLVIEPPIALVAATVVIVAEAEVAIEVATIAAASRHADRAIAIEPEPTDVVATIERAKDCWTGS